MKVVLPIVVVALAFLAGYLLPGRPSTQPEPAPAARNYQPAMPDRSDARPALSTGDEFDRALAAAPAEFGDLLGAASPFVTMHLAFDMAAAADLPALRRLAGAALATDDPLFRYSLAAVFVERMVDIDIDAALDFCEELTAGEARINLIIGVLTTWARTDEDGAFQYFASVTDRQLKERLGWNYLRDSTRSAAFRAAVQAELGPTGDWYARQLAQRQLPAAEAFERALVLPGRERAGEIMNAARRWFEQDPDAALQRISELAAGRDREIAFDAVLSDLARREPEQALFLLEQYRLAEGDLAGGVLSVVAASKPELARPYIEDYTARTGDTVPMTTLLQTWARQDPDGALAYAQSLPRHQQSNVLWAALQAYAERDPRAALQWASEQGEEGRLAIQMLSPESPEMERAVEAMLDEASDPGIQSTLLNIAIQNRLRRDTVQETLDWLAQYRDRAAYEEAYSIAMNSWAAEDAPAAAAELLRNLETTGSTAGVTQIAWTFGQSDPDAAAEWATNLPDAEGRASAIAALVQVAAYQRDMGRATELFQLLPAGRERDQAALLIASRNAGGNEQEMRDIMRDMGMPEDKIDSYLEVYWRR